MLPRSRIIYLILLSGSLLFAWFSLQQLRDTSPAPRSGLWLLGIAVLILAWVVTKAPQYFATAEANLPENGSRAHMNRMSQWLGHRVIFVIALLLGGSVILMAGSPSLQPWLILALWTLGIVMFLVGAFALDDHPASREWLTGVLAWIRERRWELLLVLVLTLLAFLLRGLALVSIPHNVHGDEGEMGMVARAVLRSELRNPFATAFLTHSTFWFFLQALAIRVFGDSIQGLRMLSALFGTLAIPVLYSLARPLYGRTVATLAAALLAGYHFHIHYSRIGLNNIADPTLMMLTLLAFFHGYSKRSWLGFALAGVLMGVAQYFYFSARLIPIVVLTLLGYLAIRDRRRLLEILRKTAVMLLGFLLSGGPLFRYYLMHPDTFSGRLLEHGLLQNGNYVKLQAEGQSLFAALANHAYRTFGFFIAITENSPFYDAGIPLLDHGMEVLFMLGLALALLSWHKLESILLLLWVGGTALFGGFLLWNFPQSPRYVIAAPALCLLLALAIVQIGTVLSQMAIVSSRISSGIISVSVLAIMSWNVYFYFGPYTARNNYASTQALTEIAYYLRPQAQNRYVYMFTSPYFYLNHGTIRFVGNEPAGTDIVETLSSSAAMPAPPPGLAPLFIFVPDRLGELDVVKQQYPHGRLVEYRMQPGNDRPIMFIYEPENAE